MKHLLALALALAPGLGLAVPAGSAAAGPGSERVRASLRANHSFGGGAYSTSRSVLAEVERAGASQATLLALHYNY